jgi:hypothetical protein
MKNWQFQAEFFSWRVPFFHWAERVAKGVCRYFTNESNFMRLWPLYMPMAVIKNIKLLSAEKLFDLLKTEFADYINEKLGSNLAIEYAHVYDVINVLFPEVIEGTALTITVTDDVLIVSVHATDSDYNTDLLEEHLIGLLKLQAS